MPLHAGKLENIGCVLPPLYDLSSQNAQWQWITHIWEIFRLQFCSDCIWYYFLLQSWDWGLLLPLSHVTFPLIIFSHTTSTLLQQQTCLCSLLVRSISSLSSFANKLSFRTSLRWITSPSSCTDKGDSRPSGSVNFPSPWCFLTSALPLSRLPWY